MPNYRTLERRDEAAARQAEYDKLSAREKLERAVERGHENTREAKRLREESK